MKKGWQRRERKEKHVSRILNIRVKTDNELYF
jgi:hypothetical protein